MYIGIPEKQFRKLTHYAVYIFKMNTVNPKTRFFKEICGGVAEYVNNVIADKGGPIISGASCRVNNHRRISKQILKSLIRQEDTLFRPLAIGDVLNGSGHPYQFALLINKDLGFLVDKPFGTIRTNDTMVNTEGFLILQSFFKRATEKCSVIGMNTFHNRIISYIQFLRGQTIDAINIIRPE